MVRLVGTGRHRSKAERSEHELGRCRQMAKTLAHVSPRSRAHLRTQQSTIDLSDLASFPWISTSLYKLHVTLERSANA